MMSMSTARIALAELICDVDPPRETRQVPVVMMEAVVVATVAVTVVGEGALEEASSGLVMEAAVAAVGGIAVVRAEGSFHPQMMVSDDLWGPPPYEKTLENSPHAASSGCEGWQ